MSKLFSAFNIDSLPLANRIVIPPMCQYSAENGEASDWHIIHYGQLAASGAGALIIEATAVEPEGRISPFDLGLWSDKTQVAFGRMLKSIRAYSPIAVGVQLAHAGRKGSSQRPWDGGKCAGENEGGWIPIAPSAIPYTPGTEAPRPLGLSEIERVKQNFAEAARRSAELGLDFIEVHMAHGYLLHEFISPISNKREDHYGGSLENRMRFPLEVFESIRKAFSLNKPVGVRISASDWVSGGWDLEQSLVLARELQKRGCAFIDVSGGGLTPEQKMPIGPNYQVPFAQTIKADLEEHFGLGKAMPVIAVGLITEAEQAEAIVCTGQADLVAVGRGMLYNPRWPWHAAVKLGAQVAAPPQYWRSQPASVRYELFNDRALKRSG